MEADLPYCSPQSKGCKMAGLSLQALNQLLHRLLKHATSAEWMLLLL